jgi:hypothetical protein
MGDSPAASETFVRQFYPEDESVEAHHKAITAQARQHERAIIMSQETHRRVKTIVETVGSLDSKVDEIKLSLAVRNQEHENERANKTHRNALTVAAIAGFAAIVGAGASVLTAVLTKEPPPIERPTLTTEELDQLRLLQQRHGYRLGQQAPSGPQEAPK